MDLIEDDHLNPSQLGILLDHPREYAFGDNL